MSKTKNKDHSELKLMRERIRDLEKEVRRLRKENSYYKKHQHQFEEANYGDSEEETEIEVIKNGITCKECARGIMREFEIMPGKCFRTCPICDHREKV